MKKSVFVTGATNGTGFAIAERFAKKIRRAKNEN